MRDFIRQFLLYTTSERRAIVVLCVLILIAYLVPVVYRRYEAIPTPTARDSSTAADIALFEKEYDMDSTATQALPNAGKVVLFTFDPNTIGIEDWLRLGLTEKQAAVIEKYKSKGGRFHKPEDIKKIYVLSDELKARLLPYIQIAKEEYKDIPIEKEKELIIDINTADSTAFEELKGIGPYRASKIVKYRELLGGYSDVAQVAEVYGLPDSVYQSILPHLTISPVTLHQINVNEADYETLKKHPYIKSKIAHAIIQWRGYNGRFETIEQLRELKSINDLQWQRLKPYISIE